MSEPLEGPTEPLKAGGAGLAAAFCLDAARMLTELMDEDLVPTVIVLGILQANVAAFNRAISSDPALPFDSLDRQAVSIYRLARNLALPYETARRHVARLIEKGLCARVGEGLTIDPGVLPAPRAIICAEEVWRLSVQLHGELTAMGLKAPPPNPEADHNEKRRVGRLANDFFLAGLKITVEATATDFVTALIFLAVSRENQAAGPRDEFLPDAQSAPISIYALSRKLRLPYETVRRHVGILIGEGLCVRVPNGGLIVPTAVFRTGPIRGATAEAWGLMSEFITAAFGPMTVQSAAA